MIYAHEVGDVVRLKGSRDVLTVTDRFWLQDAPWYSVATPQGFASVSVREAQLEAANAVGS
jgi:acetyl-CoA carboxylase alpha subunit